jgi:hypothetical protein
LVGASCAQVRDFVRSALYDPNHGYFSKRSGPVGVLDSSIRFNQLDGNPPFYLLLGSFYCLDRIWLWEFGVCVPALRESD